MAVQRRPTRRSSSRGSPGRRGGARRRHGRRSWPTRACSPSEPDAVRRQAADLRRLRGDRRAIARRRGASGTSIAARLHIDYRAATAGIEKQRRRPRQRRRRRPPATPASTTAAGARAGPPTRAGPIAASPPTRRRRRPGSSSPTRRSPASCAGRRRAASSRMSRRSPTRRRTAGKPTSTATPPAAVPASRAGVAQNTPHRLRGTATVTASAGEDEQHLEAQGFARRVARHLGEAWREKRFDELRIVAAPRFLGHLRKELDPHGRAPPSPASSTRT